MNGTGGETDVLSLLGNVADAEIEALYGCEQPVAGGVAHSIVTGASGAAAHCARVALHPTCSQGPGTLHCDVP